MLISAVPNLSIYIKKAISLKQLLPMKLGTRDNARTVE